MLWIHALMWMDNDYRQLAWQNRCKTHPEYRIWHISQICLAHACQKRLYTEEWFTPNYLLQSIFYRFGNKKWKMSFTFCGWEMRDHQEDSTWIYIKIVAQFLAHMCQISRKRVPNWNRNLLKTNTLANSTKSELESSFNYASGNDLRLTSIT